MVRVLPVPAPAKIHTGPRGAVAATRWSSSNASKSNSKELTANTTPLITYAQSNHCRGDSHLLTQSFPPTALQSIRHHAAHDVSKIHTWPQHYTPPSKNQTAPRAARQRT